MYNLLFALLAVACYAKTNTKSMYCDELVGISAGLESDFNLSAPASPGANFVQDNVICYAHSNLTNPVASLYTASTSLMSLSKVVCNAVFVFNDGSGMITHSGLYIENFFGTSYNTFVVTGGSANYEGVTGTVYILENEISENETVYIETITLDRQVWSN